MVVVAFNQVPEYLEEVEKDKGIIDRKFVRISNFFRPAKISPNIKFVSAVSTCRVNDTVVRLQKYCGYVRTGEARWNTRTIQETKKVQDQIATACKELGIEVRGGILEIEEG